MKFYYPANVDLNKLTSQLPKPKKKDEIKFAYILHLILVLPSLHKKFSSNGYTHINTKYLQRIIRNYNTYFKILMFEGIIESDNYYVQNVKAFGYRFTEKYINEFTEIDLKGKLSKQMEKDRKFYGKTLPHLSKWFNQKLAINTKLAKTELQLEGIKKGKNETPFSSNLFLVEQISKGNFIFIPNKSSGRLYTSLTNLKSTLRQFVKYNSESLVSIDICSSQPYFSCALFDKEKLELLLDNNTLSNYLPPHLPSLTIGVFEDVKLFRTLITNGTLYEYLIFEMKKELIGSEINRDQIKEIIFATFFSSNRFIGQSNAWPKRLFKKLFPNVYRAFECIKKNNKNALALFLQNLEAEVILNRVTKRISIEKPELPIFTIHDSVVTTFGNELYVDMVLKEECARVVGFEPKTKIEHWQQDESYLDHDFLMDSNITNWLEKNSGEKI